MDLNHSFRGANCRCPVCDLPAGSYESRSTSRSRSSPSPSFWGTPDGPTRALCSPYPVLRDPGSAAPSLPRAPNFTALPRRPPSPCPCGLRGRGRCGPSRSGRRRPPRRPVSYNGFCSSQIQPSGDAHCGLVCSLPRVQRLAVAARDWDPVRGDGAVRGGLHQHNQSGSLLGLLTKHGG